jgi:dimethylhistidine N-methyltransferase
VIISTARQQHTDDESIQRDSLAANVLAGFSQKPKKLSSKYFYDDTGSHLFQKITQHPDYYPTRTELEIIKEIQPVLPTFFPQNELDIIELGAGDGHKTQLIINGFLQSGHTVNYIPIDISRKAMDLLEENITPHSNLHIHGLVADYFEGLKKARDISSNTQLVLFLGSNIGNFDHLHSLAFLKKICASLNCSDYVLLGFDLKKDIKKLTAAYNDSDGHTKDFNLNMLLRINKELGANFDIAKFQHLGIYNPIIGAMESYLIATQPHEVYISALNQTVQFEAFEPIHMEYSFKYLKPDIENLSETTGFEVVQHFTDSNDYFIDSLWRVSKDT